MGASAVVVAKSNMVAVQPPCKLPKRLQCSGPTVKRKIVRPMGEEEEDRRVRCFGKRRCPHPWERRVSSSGDREAIKNKERYFFQQNRSQRNSEREPNLR